MKIPVVLSTDLYYPIMDAFLVTNHEYWYFLSETGHPMPPHWPGRVLKGTENEPVVKVTWSDARVI